MKYICPYARISKRKIICDPKQQMEEQQRIDELDNRISFLGIIPLCPNDVKREKDGSPICCIY